MKIKTIIFDIVDVLLYYPWKEWAIQTYGEENYALLNKAFWESGNWKALDQGICSAEDFLETCYTIDPDSSHWPLYKDALFRIGECSSIYPHTFPLLTSLKERGFQILFLSNYTTILRKERPDVLAFLSLMDGGLFSCDIHLTKPDPGIYQELYKKYQLHPSECLFIDDSLANVEAARELGFHTVRFMGYDASYPEILQILDSN